MHDYDPHGPYEAPDPYPSQVDRAAIARVVSDGRQEFEGMGSGADWPTDRWWSGREAWVDLSPALRFVAQLRWSYAAELAYTDAQLGRLLDGLDARGMLEDTLVVLVSDHGEGLLEHGERGHGVHIWEELVRVPMLIAHPAGEAAGTRVPARVQLADVAPTILSILGEGAVLGLADGRELWSAVRAGEALSERPVFLERPHFSRERLARRGGNVRARSAYGVLAGVLDGQDKLVREPGGAELLLDLARDPSELMDASRVYPQRVRELAGMLDDWLARNPTAPPGTLTDVTAQELEALRALGYAPPGDEPPDDEPGAAAGVSDR